MVASSKLVHSQGWSGNAFNLEASDPTPPRAEITVANMESTSATNPQTN